MNIVTKYVSRHDGRGQMKATANGKQKTVNYDHSLSREQNFANAAAALIVHLGIAADSVDPTEYTFREKDNAHIFTVRTV